MGAAPSWKGCGPTLLMTPYPERAMSVTSPSNESHVIIADGCCGSPSSFENSSKAAISTVHAALEILPPCDEIQK